MRLTKRRFYVMAFVAALVALCVAAPLSALPRRHKHKKEAVSANDPTARLYQLLDNSLDGKLNIYLVADLYTDPTKPGQQFQRVLHVIYNKDLYFGRFTIHVRSFSKLSAQQLSTYTPEQIFNYGNEDSAEFEKINPGSFGQTGDLYLLASGDRPPASSPITDEVRQEYDMLVTQYILPAVEKKIAK